MLNIKYNIFKYIIYIIKHFLIVSFSDLLSGQCEHYNIKCEQYKSWEL